MSNTAGNGGSNMKHGLPSPPLQSDGGGVMVAVHAIVTRYTVAAVLQRQLDDDDGLQKNKCGSSFVSLDHIFETG